MGTEDEVARRRPVSGAHGTEPPDEEAPELDMHEMERRMRRIDLVVRIVGANVHASEGRLGVAFVEGWATVELRWARYRRAHPAWKLYAMAFAPRLMVRGIREGIVGRLDEYERCALQWGLAAEARGVRFSVPAGVCLETDPSLLEPLVVAGAVGLGALALIAAIDRIESTESKEQE